MLTLEQSNVPFIKFIIYSLVLSRYNKTDFKRYVENYLPSVVNRDDKLFDFARSLVNGSLVPKTIINGTYKAADFKYFCKVFELTALHDVFASEAFLDFIFDTDLRRKIDGMCLSPVFREMEIFRLLSDINPEFLKIYLDCFANFRNVSQKRSFINNYIGDEEEKYLLISISETSSKNKTKMLLGIHSELISPKAAIQQALNISQSRLTNALLKDDDSKLERWIKISTQIAEKIIKQENGGRSDVDDLIAALSRENEYDDPRIYTVEELNRQFREKNPLE